MSTGVLFIQIQCYYVYTPLLHPNANATCAFTTISVISHAPY